MRDNLNTAVRRAVASQLGVALSEVRLGQRLARDLALQPLDVVLIALRMEALVDIELPFDQLDSVETVADLASWIRVVRIASRHEAIDRLAAVGLHRRDSDRRWADR